MSNNKQSNDHLPDVGEKVSSIDWLYYKMYEHRGNITIEEYEQAKAMHKEEILKAYSEGVSDEYDNQINNLPRTESEQYYNETYDNTNCN